MLYKAFPDQYRQSMRIYADHLLEGLRSAMSPAEEVTAYLPIQAALKSRLDRHWAQYVEYQLRAHFVQRDINHVIDHSFGHLIYSLDARRTVVTFHDATVFKAADGTIRGNEVSKNTILSLRYSLAATQKAAAVIAVSETSRQDFIRLTAGDPERVHVVYPGVDSSFHVLEDREALKARYALTGQYIIHVGHSLFYMNVEGVLRTLHHLVFRLNVDVKLLKVGTAFTDAQNKLVSDLRLQDRIVFLGRVAIEDLPGVYNCADVLLYPVLYAGFGFPPLEAMASGLPVVTSNRGSLPEVVGDAGILIDPDDHEAMAKSIESILKNPQLGSRLREAGLKRSRLFTWQKTAKETLEIYRKVYQANRLKK